MRQRDAWPTGPGVSSALHQYRWEENRAFWPRTNGNDIWQGYLLMAPGSWDIPLNSIWPNGGPATLLIRLWSNTEDIPDPDHHIEIMLNGKVIASLFWDGIQQKVINLPLATGELRADNSNVLTIYSPGDTGAAGEAIYIDWLHLYYEGEINAGSGQLWFSSNATNILVNEASTQLLIFDVTEEASPVLLTNFQQQDDQVAFAGRGEDGRYFIMKREWAIQPVINTTPYWKSPLRQGDRGADYIAIFANESGFAEALQPLLAYRRQQGLRVTAVNLEQIYDEFGYGQRTPEAIREFLAYALANWQEPRPRFVLLAGDATYDVRDQTAGKNRNLLPTYLFYSEQDGYVASDTWFTLFDDIPTRQGLAIGRFPAQTAAQLQIMVSKTIAYEANSEAAWTRRALLVADDEPYFDTVSNDLAAELDTNGYTIHEFHMSQNEDIHYDIMSALNKGAGIVNYAGHGAETVWGDEAVFTGSDADMLTNGSRLSIFTTFTCLSGAFTQPYVDSLAESLLWVENGGIVAAVAPSTRSQMSRQLSLAKHFYDHLLSGETDTLGEALTLTKMASAREPALHDAVYTLNLLGDPALRFHQP
jgi:hypothetical protein